MSPFILSIETTSGTRRHGFHLGTIESTARELAVERFRNTLDIITVALMRDGKIFDVYYGNGWHSELFLS